MKILFVELCNFCDYPTGGHLSFALHLLAAFGDELKLVGINTEDNFVSEKGKWTKKNINGIEYDFFLLPM